MEFFGDLREMANCPKSTRTGGGSIWFSTVIVGVARLVTPAAQPTFADGTEQNVEWNQLLQLPLGFPRGEAAERSEADEGWRQVGQ